MGDRFCVLMELSTYTHTERGTALRPRPLGAVGSGRTPANPNLSRRPCSEV
jgi:hypothetical protein